ncbi:hypothetical protein D3C81_1985440 [compost metagenome]
MRHLGDIGNHRLAIDGLAKRKCKLGFRLLEVATCQHFAQINHFALLVRQFNADNIATRNNGDTRGNGAHGTGDIIRQSNDTG